MGFETTERVCEWYFRIILHDGKNVGLLMRLMNLLVEKRKLSELERIVADSDEATVLRAASRKMSELPGEVLDAIDRISARY